MSTTFFSLRTTTILSILMLVLLLPIASNAQSGFVIGPNVGVGFSKLKYTNLINAKMSTNNIVGYHGGINVGWRFSDRFTLLSGFSLMQRGMKFAEENKAYRDESGQTYLGFLTGEEKTSFFSIPAIARFKLFKGNFGVVLSAGVSYNIGRDGTGFKYVQANNGKVYAGRYEMIEFGEDIDNVYAPTQLSCLLGGGFLIPIGSKSRLVLNATLDLGLTDALNQRYKQANTIFERAFNRSTLLSIGYEYAFEISDKY